MFAYNIKLYCFLINSMLLFFLNISLPFNSTAKHPQLNLNLNDPWYQSASNMSKDLVYYLIFDFFLLTWCVLFSAYISTLAECSLATNKHSLFICESMWCAEILRQRMWQIMSMRENTRARTNLLLLGFWFYWNVWSF